MANSTFYNTIMVGKFFDDGSIEGTFGGNLYFKRVDQGQTQPAPAKVVEMETKGGMKYRAIRLTLQIQPDNAKLENGKPARPILCAGKSLTFREYLERRGVEIIGDKVYVTVTATASTPGLYQLLSKADLSFKTPVLVSGTLSIYDRKDKSGKEGKGLALNRVTLCCVDHTWDDKPEEADKWKHLEKPQTKEQPKTAPASAPAQQEAAPPVQDIHEEIGFTFIPEDEIPF